MEGECGIAKVSTIRAKFVNLFWTDPKLLEIILFDFNGLISFYKLWQRKCIKLNWIVLFF